MKALIPGSDYLLDSFHGSIEQRLLFVRGGLMLVDGKFMVKNDGTTNEEVIDVLLHRLNHQNKQKPCKETAMAITKLEEAQLWLEARTAAHGVEG